MTKIEINGSDIMKDGRKWKWDRSNSIFVRKTKI